MTTDTHVAIVGAGPYGLAAAAHLRGSGVEPLVFGTPMESWERHMPAGMRLRSGWSACHISDPRGALTLDAFEDEIGRRIERPVPIADFVEYGRWFQREIAPAPDHRKITFIRRTASGLQLELEDGDSLRARRVIVATGIASFARWPALFTSLPDGLVTHSAEHRTFTRFAGRRVLVVGGGQSALESAALLAEAGARPEVIVRSDRLTWLHGPEFRRRFGPLEPLAYPWTDVGPPGLSQIVARPGLFKTLPVRLQDRIAVRSIRPAGAAWLPDRLSEVPISTDAVPLTADTDGAEVRVRLASGAEHVADHVLLATGYNVDVRCFRFLGEDLLRDMRLSAGFPVLRGGFESAVPGLHFVGAPAARSFGPLMRFVAGTRYTSRALAASLADESPAGRETWTANRSPAKAFGSVSS